MRYIRTVIAKLRGKPLPPEEISAESFSNFTDPNAPPTPRASKKPLVVFLLAVFGLPYLMGKFIKAIAHSQSHAISSRPLDSSSTQLYRARFDFIPRNRASEIPLRKGDVIAVTHRNETNWWRARSRDGLEGYVPATYLEAIHNPIQQAPIISPPGERGHAFIEEFKDEPK